ncbi:FkbM family methyltransferase [Bradyrhizobium sp. USDA 4369]
MSRLLRSSSGFGWCPSPGGKLLVSLNDAIGRCVFFTGDYDRKLTWLCRRILRTGDTAIDIGANIGLVSLTMARCVGPEGRIHAFEPNPRLQDLFKQSLRENHYRNVCLHECALGNQPGFLDLHVPRGNFGQGSFKYHAKTSNAEHYRCRVERLSDLIERDGLEQIRLVKIDVEGFEYEVLSGAGLLLRSIRPDVIILETNEQNQPRFSERAVIRLLRQSDFTFLEIPRSLFSVKITEMNPDTLVTPSHDVIAVPTEKYDAVLRRLS